MRCPDGHGDVIVVLIMIEENKMTRTDEIRNVAIIGHSGEGKTTLTEAILFNAGAIDRQG